MASTPSSGRSGSSGEEPSTPSAPDGLLSALRFAQQAFSSIRGRPEFQLQLQQVISVLAYPPEELGQHPLLGGGGLGDERNTSLRYRVADLVNDRMLGHWGLLGGGHRSALGVCLRQLRAVLERLGPQGLALGWGGSEMAAALDWPRD